ncbi:helix-turn-helix domain-containing protein [Cellvibrio sp. OA-2007]|uniref:helix-turn-helix domain-containing protein n=1 Tax=Cellvibrio sp. OA-2007 TaxID=529823 RepID=UPI000AC47FBB
MVSLTHMLYSPAELARSLGQNARQLRLARNLSRKTLAKLSGVSESSIKRFEVSGSITLESLILLAAALDQLAPISALFKPEQPSSIAELKNARRKRGAK